MASGFTLVFGLMRNVNLAHGSLYLLGAYIGYEVTTRTGYWLLGVAAGFAVLALVGLVMQVFVFRRLEGDDLRQTLVTIGISIVAADLMLAVWTGATYQLADARMAGRRGHAADRHRRSSRTAMPSSSPIRSTGWWCWPSAIVIGVGLWLMLNRTRVGMMIRAGVDDRAMLSATGVNVHVVFAIVFALGAGLAGFAGVVGGSALSVAPGEDVRYLLASLVVVIVGGMGSITGRGDRRAADRARRADRPRLFPDLRHRAHLRDHGRGTRHPAARHHGEGAMSAVTADRGRAGRPQLGRDDRRRRTSCWPRC